MSDTPRPVEPPKPDVPADAGKPAEDPAKPPTTLQTTPTQQEGEQERRIRVRLSQAANSLNRINYQALNTDGRMQYDTTKRLINQPEPRAPSPEPRAPSLRRRDIPVPRKAHFRALASTSCE